jgi:hypothetical protein
MDMDRERDAELEARAAEEAAQKADDSMAEAAIARLRAEAARLGQRMYQDE